MPRPRKCRKVCSMPAYTVFGPETVGTDNQCADCHENAFSEKAVMMTVDEYETVRLIDKEGFSQEECSRYMNVARTTVQSIYNKARKKIAEALVEGKTLVIRGGSYMLCDGSEQKLEADTIAVAVGYRSENRLFQELQGLDAQLFQIGDANKVANIHYAIWDAYEVARGI